MAGKFDKLLKQPLKSTAAVDWKMAAKDVLLNVRMKWMKKYPALGADTLDELASNHATETPEVFLPALGQELTTVELRLYTVDADADDYCLVVATPQEGAELEQEAAAAGKRVRLELQPRRRLGQPAKRLDVAGRIPFRSTRLHNYGLQQVGAHALAEHWREKACSIVSLASWPPVSVEMPVEVQCHCTAFDAGSGIGAAIVEDKQTKTADLRIGRDFSDWANWKRIDTGEPVHALSRVAFFGDDLVVAHGVSAWTLEGAVTGPGTWRKLGEAQPHPDFENAYLAASGDGRGWVILSGQLFEYTGGRLTATGMRIHKPWSFGSTPTPGGFAYVDNQGRVVELNPSTGKERVRALPHLDFKTAVWPFADGWSIFMRSGFPERKLDLAQFWRPADDTWLRLRYGALGDGDFRDCALTPGGDTWVASNSHVFDLGQTDQLLAALGGSKSGVLKPQPWSDWQPSGEQRAAGGKVTGDEPLIATPAMPTQQNRARKESRNPCWRVHLLHCGVADNVKCRFEYCHQAYNSLNLL